MDTIDLVAKNKEEKLFTARPRHTPQKYVDVAGGGSYWQTEFDDRGTPASLRILTDDASRSSWASSRSGGSNLGLDYLNSEKGLTNFLLTDIQSQFTEKVQVTEVFGDTEVAYYFGKSPVMFSLAGLLIDSVDNDWFVQFLVAYDKAMRGTQLARNYELIEVNLPNMKIIGTITDFRYSQNAARDTEVPFGITILAKQIYPISTTIPSVPLTNEAVLIDFGRAEGFTNFTSLQNVNNLKASIDSMASRADSLIPSELKESLMTAGGSFANAIGAYTNVPSTLLGVRSGLFSPVYGIVSSITKVVQATTGDVTDIVSSFTDPVQSILRDIRTVSTQAMGLVTMVENSVDKIINEPLSVIHDYRATLINLENTSGAISRMPETISESIGRLYKSGSLSSSAPFLRSGSSGADKTALLSSGVKYTSTKGAYL